MTFSYKVYQQIREGGESPRLSSSPNGSCSPRDSPVSLNQQTLKQRVSDQHQLLDHDCDIIMVILMIFETAPKKVRLFAGQHGGDADDRSELRPRSEGLPKVWVSN